MIFKSKTYIIRRGLLGCRSKLSFMCLPQVGKGRVKWCTYEMVLAQLNRALITRNTIDTGLKQNHMAVVNKYRMLCAQPVHSLLQALEGENAWRHPCRATAAWWRHVPYSTHRWAIRALETFVNATQ